MRKLIIIVEGQTELEFVKNILIPYFNNSEIYDVVSYCVRTSKTSKGGLDNYFHLKNDIQKGLNNKHKDIIITTFVDFFRIPNNFPSYEKAMLKANSMEKVNTLEEYFGKDINDSRFIPYIQLHEFEALLFSSNKGFEKYEDEKIYNKTQEIINNFDNPEDINSSPQTAPSKRLLSIKPNYKKVFEGNIIAMEIGMETMLNKCPRFKNWIETLISRVKEKESNN